MPKFKYTEKDYTGETTTDGVSSVVYIPCVATNAISPKLVTTLSELTSLSTLDVEKGNYKIAKYLISHYHIPLVVEGVAGNGSINSDKLLDKSFDIRFLTLGVDFLPSSGASINDNMKAIVDIATKRKDAIALVDHPSNVVTVSDIRTFFGKLDSYFSGVESYDKDIGNSYCMYGSPWFKSNNTTDLPENLPYSIGYLFAYLNSLENGNPEYYAIANKDRGFIPELKKPVNDYSYSDIERLQSRSATDGTIEIGGADDNNSFAVNAIANIRPNGYMIWGNRTARNNAGELKAISYLNVRNMLCSVSKECYDKAQQFKFEQNSDVLFINYKRAVSKKLDSIKLNNGFSNYVWEKKDTTKKGLLVANLKLIKPIEGLEDVDLTVELVND